MALLSKVNQKFWIRKRSAKGVVLIKPVALDFIEKCQLSLVRERDLAAALPLIDHVMDLLLAK